MTSVIETQSESIVTDLLSGESSSAVADILRGFDELRRQLARKVSGAEGIAIGYEHLVIDRDAIGHLGQETTVSLAAMHLDVRQGSHEVEYVASVLPGINETTGRSHTLVRARGWTLTPPSTGGGIR